MPESAYGERPVRRAAHLGVSITEGKEHAEEKFGY
jgi:hypothetical protein